MFWVIQGTNKFSIGELNWEIEWNVMRTFLDRYGELYFGAKESNFWRECFTHLFESILKENKYLMIYGIVPDKNVLLKMKIRLENEFGNSRKFLSRKGTEVKLFINCRETLECNSDLEEMSYFVD